MQKHGKGFTEPLFLVRRHLIKTLIVSDIFSAVLIWIYIHFGFFFRGGSGWQLFQLLQQFASVCQRFLFVYQQQHFQLITYFHRPVIFLNLVDFPNDLKFAARNFHFPVNLSTIVIRLNIHSQLFERTYSVFCKKSYSQQVYEPVYK